jgi:hypothetical protein
VEGEEAAGEVFGGGGEGGGQVGGGGEGEDLGAEREREVGVGARGDREQRRRTMVGEVREGGEASISQIL